MPPCEHPARHSGPPPEAKHLPLDFRAQFHEAHEWLCEDCILDLVDEEDEMDSRLIGYVDFGPKPVV